MIKLGACIVAEVHYLGTSGDSVKCFTVNANYTFNTQEHQKNSYATILRFQLLVNVNIVKTNFFSKYFLPVGQVLSSSGHRRRLLTALTVRSGEALLTRTRDAAARTVSATV